MDRRLAVLEAVANSGLSIDFLKLTPSGMSFVVPQDQDHLLKMALESARVESSVRADRSIVTVHAVNMRDEEGLIAGIVQSAIASGAQIDHIGDGFDRLLLVVSAEHAEKLATVFRWAPTHFSKKELRAGKQS
jgi:aspartokinase